MSRARKLDAARRLAEQGATPGERQAARRAVERLTAPLSSPPPVPLPPAERGWRVLSRPGTRLVVAVSPRDARLTLTLEEARHPWRCTSCHTEHLPGSPTWRPAVRTRLAREDRDTRLCPACLGSGDGRLLP